jgi:hypothetical protein
MELIVNQKTVGMNAFVDRIVFNVVGGMLESLEDVPENPRSATFTLGADGEALSLLIDQQDIRMNAFVRALIGGILRAILQALDGIPDPPETVTFRLA